MTTYGSEVQINMVVWITSLNESEYGTTRYLLEDLEPYFKSKNVGFLEFQPKSADDLMVFFDVLAEKAEEGLRPIIHIDTHGSPNGLIVEPTGETASWEEIVEKFRILNTAAKNNVCMISMACFGFNQIMPVKIMSPTPFYLMAGSTEEVYVRFIREVTVDFYKHVFDECDIVGAYETYLRPQLRVLHCEKVLFTAMAGYVRAGTYGALGRQRVEDLITAAISTLPEGVEPDLKQMRKIAKEGMKPKQELLDRMAATFLIGKPVPYNIDAIIEQAKKMPDPYADGKRKRPSPLNHV